MSAQKKGINITNTFYIKTWPRTKYLCIGLKGCSKGDNLFFRTCHGCHHFFCWRWDRPLSGIRNSDFGIWWSIHIFPFGISLFRLLWKNSIPHDKNIDTKAISRLLFIAQGVGMSNRPFCNKRSVLLIATIRNEFIDIYRNAGNYNLHRSPISSALDPVPRF